MNPQQLPPFSQTLGALVVAASESILQGNDLAQASCTEDTIAEDLSDASQDTLDAVVDGNVSTSTPPLTSFSMPSVPSEISSVLAQNIASCDELKHLQNGVLPMRNEGECNNRKKDHKKRSKNWSMLETLKLIRARARLDERFRKSGRKAALWDEIAQALQKADVSRDGQQCKDKWEKLTAGYKEVRDGARDKEDLPFYKEIHQLLSCKHDRKESGLMDDGAEVNKRDKVDYANGHTMPSWKAEGAPYVIHEAMELREVQKEEASSFRKRKRAFECVSVTDMTIVQELLETILTTQQHLFKDLLDAVEKKEQLREQIRQEREETWRAEERAQRFAFNNTMVLLTQRLLGERSLGGVTTAVPAPTVLPPMVSSLNGLGSSKKRSKNWKRTEVFHLIRFRREMETKFAKSTRRAGLWEELGDRLVSLGIKRDGKQCREKWDKLMAGYKDVVDGRKDKEESPYFSELSIYVEMTKELKDSIPAETTKEEHVEAIKANAGDL